MGMPSEQVRVNCMKTAVSSCWAWAGLALFLTSPQASVLLLTSLGLFLSFSQPHRVGLGIPSIPNSLLTFACVSPCRIWSSIFSFSMMEYAFLFLKVLLVAIFSCCKHWNTCTDETAKMYRLIWLPFSGRQTKSQKLLPFVKKAENMVCLIDLKNSLPTLT